jgi:signal transduction histidine kinase
MSKSEARILYVDDEPGNRLVFEQSFARRFNVDAVASGEEALEALRRETYAVVVTDQRMPGMSGNELLEKVKLIYEDTIRIVVTAYDDLSPILRAVNDGLVARYVVKPWDRKELEDLLAWALEAFELGRESSAIQLRLLQTERLATIGMLSRAVFHDMNQPLSYVLSNAGRLQDFSGAAAALRRAVEATSAQLSNGEREQLLLLAEELPDLARDMVEGCDVLTSIMRGPERLLRTNEPDQPMPCHPPEVVRYVTSVCRRQLQEAGAGLVCDVPSDVPLVEIGFAELAQTMINLVMNASQAVAKSRQRPGQIIIAASKSDDGVRITVSDNGPGMSPETLERAGTPFFTTRPGGTGLGLAQCHRLVGAAGGKVRARSNEGVGTKVELTLPVHQRHVARRDLPDC